ncbi:GH92 family glycosyl hydrolase [Dysgonomonas sp. BGC7]|uniref:GH92 family glycosyl hydrolase n=1 Tax=Dysgonomonas sp. BGC7 TaxID=1658008 RepID=UPI00068273E6|nr:GH92 family glycosyl hydrolase [Dysgonomonas sp. BGC7]MBD8389334.1 GH92 family glycosyl hydrolase [Dysgonomonas sp. BGC7]
MRKIYLSLLLIVFISFINLSCSTDSTKVKQDETRPSDYVSTLVGTLSTFSLSTGNTYPATAVPWGMNFWTPQTGKMGDGWVYNYAESEIRGLKQTHQPSPWINDYGQFAIMPVNGRNKIDQDSRKSKFSHKSEIAKPYYYSVYLGSHNIMAEVAPTERAAIMRFTFPESNESAVVIDAFDKGSYIKIIPDKNTIEGYTTRNSGGVPDNFCNWFVIEFDTPFTVANVWKDGGDIVTESTEYKGNHAGAIIGFDTKRGQQVNVRIASSFISTEQAYTNLKEVSGHKFDEVKDIAQQRWDDVLGRIKVEGGTDEQYRTFYSCLYRSLLFPRKFYEITEAGEVLHYSPYNGKVLPGYMYTDTGFWDTFRSLFPLLNLVYPSVNQEIQQGLENVAKESGFLPEWASPGHRDCMIGNNSASVVADAAIKGVTGQDLKVLYDALLHGTENVYPSVSSTGRLGHEYYNTLGYVPYDVNINENAARTLEYAYNDWCILQLAKKLGRPQEELDKWASRALNYRNVFDPTTNLMRGRNKDGSFQEPFSPYKWGDAFTEGNSWHYTWSVFHDVQGLINLMGGEDRFTQMLDSIFIVPPIFDDSYYGYQIHEITEMMIMNMGNYAHGNQPIQHMIYLYDWARQPWKTQYWAREVMDRLYTAAPDGYCGDEDNGQTSAWYVFSALGFYPVCPGTNQYALGSPLFENVTITLENGKQIGITANNNSKSNRYIRTMSVNGKPYLKNFITHEDLMDGANINYQMSKNPEKERGVQVEDKPYSLSMPQ